MRSPLEKLRNPRHSRELLSARLFFLVLSVAAFDLVAAGLFLWAEEAEPGTHVTNYGDALFWTSSQLTTVSSSLPNPLTTEGRILSVGLDVISITFISLLFGAMANHLNITGSGKLEVKEDDPSR